MTRAQANNRAPMTDKRFYANPREKGSNGCGVRVFHGFTPSQSPAFCIECYLPTEEWLRIPPDGFVPPIVEYSLPVRRTGEF